MCQLYCPGRGHSVRWFELSVKALPQGAMNMCLPRVVWGIPRNWGCCSNPATLQKSLNDPKIVRKTQSPKNFQKINIKAPHQLHQTHVLVWIFPWSKVIAFGRIWGGKSGFESEILWVAPPKFLWNLRRKRFFDHPPHPSGPKNHPFKRGGHNFFHDSPQHFRHSICSFSDKALHHLGHSHFEVFLRHMLTSLAQGEHSGLGTKVWGNPQGVLESVHDKIMACASYGTW